MLWVRDRLWLPSHNWFGHPTSRLVCPPCFRSHLQEMQWLHLAIARHR
jgi:hypothetical protein